MGHYSKYRPIYVQIAEEMLLGLDDDDDAEIAPELKERLDRIDTLCGRVRGGSLTSRQVIASVIEAWEREQK